MNGTSTMISKWNNFKTTVMSWFGVMVICVWIWVCVCVSHCFFPCRFCYRLNKNKLYDIETCWKSHNATKHEFQWDLLMSSTFFTSLSLPSFKFDSFILHLTAHWNFLAPVFFTTSGIRNGINRDKPIVKVKIESSRNCFLKIHAPNVNAFWIKPIVHTCKTHFNGSSELFCLFSSFSWQISSSWTC